MEFNILFFFLGLYGNVLQRQKFDFDQDSNDSDYSDKDEEQPQIVVVRTGDLTAEEAEREKQRIETGKYLL